jgi:molybdopterin converting factor small subunit
MFEVTVRFHAGARESAGVAETRLSLNDGDTIARLKDRLLLEFPGLGRYRNSLLFAVREDYVAASHVLKTGDGVSCFPPVSGG